MRPEILNPLFAETEALKGVGTALAKPLAKLGLTLVATGLSVFALRPLAHTAAATLGGGGPGTDLVVAPSVALVVYGTATVLSIYKPRGRTPFAR